MNELQKYKEQQLAVKINNMSVLNLSKEEILKSFDKDELNIIKSQFGKMLDVIEKGKAANIGEIREWSGKKYKKQSNGKWLEVSESHGKTKKEHEFESDVKKESASLADKDKKDFVRDTKLESSKLHSEQASKLSDKEHSDEEVGLGEKKDEEVKREKFLVTFHTTDNSGINHPQTEMIKIPSNIEDKKTWLSNWWDKNGKKTGGYFRDKHLKLDRVHFSEEN